MKTSDLKVSNKKTNDIFSSKTLHEYLDTEVYLDTQNIRNPLVRITRRYLLRHLRPNTRIVYMIRKMQYYYNSKNALKRLYALYLHRKIWNESSCYISPLAVIGKGLNLPHPVGIVIGGAVRIGSNVNIYQHVTIGSRRKGDYKKGMQPIIEDGVTCFSNAQILGDITIGEGSVIGAGAVVISSVSPHTVSVGVPSKELIKNCNNQI